jgi:hypothetical protein
MLLLTMPYSNTHERQGTQSHVNCMRAACLVMLSRDSVAALKRLLREVFAEQLTIKQRLTDAEKAAKASAQLEAADDYQLRLAQGSGSSWCRAPARMSGHVTAAGVLPWSQVRCSQGV